MTKLTQDYLELLLSKKDAVDSDKIYALLRAITLGSQSAADAAIEFHVNYRSQYREKSPDPIIHPFALMLNLFCKESVFANNKNFLSNLTDCVEKQPCAHLYGIRADEFRGYEHLLADYLPQLVFYNDNFPREFEGVFNGKCDEDFGLVHTMNEAILWNSFRWFTDDDALNYPKFRPKIVVGFSDFVNLSENYADRHEKVRELIRNSKYPAVSKNDTFLYSDEDIEEILLDEDWHSNSLTKKASIIYSLRMFFEACASFSSQGGYGRNTQLGHLHLYSDLKKVELTTIGKHILGSAIAQARFLSEMVELTDLADSGMRRLRPGIKDAFEIISNTIQNISSISSDADRVLQALPELEVYVEHYLTETYFTVTKSIVEPINPT